MSGNKTISSVLIPLQQRPLLLPTACIVEVLDYTRPVASQTDVNWLLGNTHWRGQDIPVISYELLNQRRFAEFSATNRILVVRRTTEESGIPFYGIVVQGLPQPLELNREEIQPTEDIIGPADKTQIQLREIPAILPDLAFIEAELQSVLLQHA